MKIFLNILFTLSLLPSFSSEPLTEPTEGEPTKLSREEMNALDIEYQIEHPEEFPYLFSPDGLLTTDEFEGAINSAQETIDDEELKIQQLLQEKKEIEAQIKKLYEQRMELENERRKSVACIDSNKSFQSEMLGYTIRCIPQYPESASQDKATVLSNHMFQEYRRRTSINLVKEFLEKLQSNTYFSGKDKHYFFSASAIKLRIPKKGDSYSRYDNSDNTQARYSHLGELVRLHRHCLILKNARCEIYADVESEHLQLFEDDKNIEPATREETYRDSPFVNVTVRFTRESDELAEYSKHLVITLKVYCAHDNHTPCILLESVEYNGASFCQRLGFGAAAQCLSKAKAKELEAHIDSLNAMSNLKTSQNQH